MCKGVMDHNSFIGPSVRAGTKHLANVTPILTRLRVNRYDGR